MKGPGFLNRQTVAGALVFVVLFWTLSAFVRSTPYTFQSPETDSATGLPLGSRPGQAEAGDKPAQPHVSLPPWYPDEESENDHHKAEAEAAPASPTTTSAAPVRKVRPTSITTTRLPQPPAAAVTTSRRQPAATHSVQPIKSTRPGSTSPSSSHFSNNTSTSISGTGADKGDRPLVIYVFADRDPARDNLAFFVKQGLHAAADFIFVLQGPTDADKLIPKDLPNVRIIRRQNTCFDLGAIGEVLRRDYMYRQYKRFITMNASIRGPFMPYWAKGCWTDAYLNRLTDKVKLVGMTSNCWPQFHVQSMIWATDSIGIDLLLHPPPGTGRADQFGNATDPVAFAGCYSGWDSAVHAEVGTTAMLRGQGYDVDVMMMAFHQSDRYIEDCAAPANSDGAGDLLWNGRYYGSNVHPYETVFIKANRDIDPKLIEHLSDWHLKSNRTSWDTCGAGHASVVGT